MRDHHLVSRLGVIFAAATAIMLALAEFSTDTEPVSPIPRPSVMATALKTAPIERLEDGYLFGVSLSRYRLGRPVLIEGAVEPLDATSFRSGVLQVRLRHVRGPERNAVCRDGNGALWSCGLQARAALINVLRAQAVTCQPALDTPGERDSFDCRVGDVNLSRLLVQLGWARPVPLSSAIFAQDVATARAAYAGLWRGNWSVVERPNP